MEKQLPNTKNPENQSEDEDNTSSGETPAPINLQKRMGDVEATRYGDWELNGRCIDF